MITSGHEDIWDRYGVVPIVKKMPWKLFRWYAHVIHADENSLAKFDLSIEVAVRCRYFIFFLHLLYQNYVAMLTCVTVYGERFRDIRTVTDHSQIEACF